MREILFRAKRVDNGEWVEGAYYKQTEWYGDPCEYHYIITSKDELEDNMTIYHEILPETIGYIVFLFLLKTGTTKKCVIRY